MSEQRDADAIMREAAEVLESAIPSGGEDLPADARQLLLAASVRLFVAGVERGTGIGPFPADAADAPTATDVMVAATAFLAASEIELFELGMWQTWGGVSVGSAPKGDANGSA